MGSWELRGVSRITDSYICTILSNSVLSSYLGSARRFATVGVSCTPTYTFYVGIVLNDS